MEKKVQSDSSETSETETPTQTSEEEEVAVVAVPTNKSLLDDDEVDGWEVPGSAPPKGFG